MYDWLGPTMFLGALVILGIGYPVAFSLGATAIVFGIIGVSLGIFDPIIIRAMPSRIFNVMSNYTLLAIPYFIFLGSMLEKSGLAEDLLDTMGILFGPVRGGLAIAVVAVGALLAATTGVVAATVVAMGLISLPIMLRYNYNKELACGVICAAGTLGQIIPPSVVLVVLGDQIGVSVGKLFLGSLIPGLLLAAALAFYCWIVALLKPEMAPALPLSARSISGAALAKRVVQVMIPPLLLIVAVLGSIFFGISTATEAGAVGALGATLLAAANRRLTWKNFVAVCDATMRATTMVLFILIGSTAFALVFRALSGDKFVFDLMANLPGGAWGFLVVSMLIVFFLGFFIDFFEICFIVIPLFVPVAQALGFDLIWFGVLLGANLQTSFLTPPFGFALFYLRGVAPPGITTADIYRGVVPFIAIQLTIVVVLIFFPQLALYLPAISFGQ
ncbi:MAG TPA: C4-dicarboxylate ABC transporter [Chloroflexus aurantiacus]|jgi:tripartite ATP-independent transporter DctM subunit|uniref:TRAP dicarboxylate transporter, DctM subunit n=1 Tax=Chloroflexus aurantiacus (strain ATCC 29366 / DSM 635 / J-10-fl) TaxID=324602 RepID=A9WGK6_CHLAA|nr:TRAP transporter large permease subunit [Chloroflexus aurantiacus]ABY35538.1 TRAP dicarboxylate transporter, DctM subunit [Chloroflexus aurantiacus J-10-fl]RMG50243.1 MAG: TRAP transporter large permease subunit [Chloroflexota bacterium]GIV92012.1 MAG: C4-dicarboxylate ABC transporter [Chloroflexus sp.]HBW69162.1 C4-dicarboxylate ABC transporter [Chloroflexus aurantiacus]